MTALPAWREEEVDRRHDRASFDCGQPDLNTFLSRYARQSSERGIAKTFCAIRDDDGRTVLGYYTICPASVSVQSVPTEARPQGGGQYDVGGFRLARLAVAREYQGLRLGGHLLMNAVRRCMRASEEVGGTAVVIDAKDDDAARWYARYGARPLLDRSLTLMITYDQFRRALEIATRES